ncbi:MAG: TetR/AcrR family transcriptional regulator [Actinobacteria bacterium]|nr:TetR/AcrR family transcriptional regulator [Actinomycetota bacterium]
MSSKPKTERGRASRERIVERAAELVAEHGVQGTSLDDVLVAAGASKSQLYHYFADRDDLVEAVVANRCEQAIVELTQLLKSVSRLPELEQMLAGYVASYEQSPTGCPIGTLASEVADRNEGARLQTVVGFAAWERLFVDVFERMRESGELRAEASSESLATALLASLQGGILLSQTRRDSHSLHVAVEAAVAHIRSFAS